ncbi:MAG: UvrD-helicase domain-containing protein [Rhodothermales bacterium]|nr:UvrD-helicase domain-containing protein [Rhodothermales bacterium]MDG2016069.1 UvrD-helicase domain-containing protein [Rhodothermales bacterium]
MTQFTLLPDSNAPAHKVSPTDILKGLNEVQREAVEALEGAVLIVAGPGSGKTRTLTHRIAYLISSNTARPWQILAITFTNKAAREMRERVLELVGEETGKGMAIGTFHSMFARMLRVEGEHIGYTSDFTIYDSDDSQRLLRDLMNRFGIDTTEFKPRAVHHIISGAKNKMVSPAEYAQLAVSPVQVRAAELYQPYQDALRSSNAMDFDDLLLKPIQLFDNHPDILEKYQERWKFIHIDEYQDTNKAQYLLARMLAKKHRNLCVVGDDAQSIYAFRGADITNILSFQRDYPNAQTIRLEQNYRSSQRIVRFADSIIKNNRDQIEKNLWTDNDEGDPVISLESISERDEAQKVERRIRDVQVRLGHLNKDFAVLYRTNAQSRSLEDALRRGGIPYRVVGGVSFYQRREIKDALAYLRLLVNPNDLASLRRVINLPVRGIGAKTQSTLWSYAAAHQIGAWEGLERVQETGLTARAVNAVSVFRDLLNKYRELAATDSAADISRALIKESGLLDDLRKENTPENLVRWENVQELLNAIAEFTQDKGDDATLSAFLQEISLLTDADETKDSDNRVTLMTLHASKGLEFPVVFLTGLEEGLFPLAMAAQDPKELEEERRLFYVGATRAKTLLFLSNARSRFRFGEQQPMVRSRFYEEIDPSVVRTETGQVFDPNTDRFKSKTSGASYDKVDPFYYRKNLRESTQKPKAPTSKERRVVYDEEESTAIAPGMTVEHHLFGEGKVLSMEGNGAQTKAIVFFKDAGQKKLILRFARLQRIG